MSNGLIYPQAGTRIRVYTKPYSLAWMNQYPSRPPEGIVQERRDKSALVLANPGGHSPYIEWDRVARLEYLDEEGKVTGSATPVDAQHDTKEELLQSWQVDGSKGKTYTVARRDNSWSCTCVAGSFGKTCKHVTKIKEELSDAAA